MLRNSLFLIFLLNWVGGKEISCWYSMEQCVFFSWQCHLHLTFSFSCKGARAGGDHRPYTAPFFHPGHLTGSVHNKVLSWTETSTGRTPSAPPQLVPPTHTESPPQASTTRHWWWASLKGNICVHFSTLFINIYWYIYIFFPCIKAPLGINPLEHEELPMSVQQVQHNVKPILPAVPNASRERDHGAFSQVNALPLTFSIKPNDTVTLYRARMDNRDVILRVLKVKWGGVQQLVCTNRQRR